MITLDQELSTAEKRMFQDLGWAYLFDTDIPVMSFYEIAIKKAFIKGQENGAVSALRRAAMHFANGAYRGNKNFEELISY